MTTAKKSASATRSSTSAKKVGAKKVTPKKADTKKAAPSKSHAKKAAPVTLPDKIQGVVSHLQEVDNVLSSIIGVLEAEGNGAALYKVQIKWFAAVCDKIVTHSDKIQTAGERFENKRIRDLAKTDKAGAALAKKVAKIAKMRSAMEALEAEIAD